MLPLVCLSLLLIATTGAVSETSYACEGQTLSLSCPVSSTLEIHTANYGRLLPDSQRCPRNSILSFFHNVNCKSSNSIEIVTEQCNGMRSCDVDAVNSKFGDPCRGTYKYLEVSYSCKKDEVVCYEGDGKSYAGKVSTSKSGKTCQSWISQTPHEHFRWNPKQKDPSNYPDNSIEEAANYCRSPDHTAPYCYTMDKGTRWEECDIPKCAAPTTVAPTTVAPTTAAPTTVAPVPETVGLKYKERCNSRSPPCGEANTECRAYRCFCKAGYERSGDQCVPQDTLPLGHRCSAQGARCADDNSQCRAYRCFCKAGFNKSGTQCV